MNENIIKSGVAISKISSATVIASLSTFTSPILAVTIGGVITELIDDFADRMLSKYEKRRIGASASYIIQGIKLRLDDNDLLRNDGPFSVSDREHLNVSKVFEGVLLRCKDEFEELKIKYISNIFINLVFDSSLSLEDAVKLIATTEKLTFRQICILRIYSDVTPHKYLRAETKKVYTDSDIFLLNDLEDLIALGLLRRLFIRSPDSDREINRHEEQVEMNHWDSLIPDSLSLSNYGKLLYKFLSLDQIPKIALLNVEDLLCK